MATITRVSTPAATGGGVATRNETREALYADLINLIHTTRGVDVTRVKPFVEGKVRKGAYGLMYTDANTGEMLRIEATVINPDKFVPENFVTEGSYPAPPAA